MSDTQQAAVTVGEPVPPMPPDSVQAAEAALQAAELAIQAAGAAKDYPGILRAWIGTMINGSPVARNTEAFNYLTMTAVPELLSRLQA